MRASLNFKGQKIQFEVEKCEGIKKYIGLMFKSQEASALLFEDMNEKAIHSFLCPDFLAIWLYEGKIIDYKLVTGNKPYIKPKERFDKLLEIPLNEKYSQITKLFLDTSEIKISDSHQ